MKLTKEDIGKKFNTRGGEIALLVHYSIDECCVSTDTGVDAECLYLVTTHSGTCCEDGAINIESRHDPRSWLSGMPTLTGDQWKDSKISVTELRQWQADNS